MSAEDVLADASPVRQGRSSPPLSLCGPQMISSGAILWLGASVLTVMLCLVVRGMAPANTDVSWLLDMATQWLDGRRPYVDIIEVNPPASILIYMPAVLAARAIGSSPEFIVVVMVAAATVASLLLTGLILDRGTLLRRETAAPYLCAALLVLLLMPGDCLGQREHIALVASLPMLAALSARVRGAALPWTLACLAGFGGGLALAIKPPFVLAFVGPCAMLGLSQTWRTSLAAAEVIVAGMIAALYGAGVLAAAPAFSHVVLPMVLAAYVPVRLSLPDLVTAPTTMIWLTALIGWYVTSRHGPGSVLARSLALASIGFEACFFIQGKGFAYQALPAVSLAILAIVSEVFAAQTQPPTRRSSVSGLILAGAMACLALLAFDQRYDLGRDAPGLADAVRRVSPNPTMVVLSTDIAVGHPFVTEVGGQWVGSLASNWLAGGIAKLERGDITAETRRTLDRLAETERSIVARDISQGRPDVILIDSRLPPHWIETSPIVMRALTPYRDAGHYGPIALWTRAPALDTAAARPLPTGE